MTTLPFNFTQIIQVPQNQTNSTTNSSKFTVMQISNIAFYSYYALLPLISFIFLVYFYYSMKWSKSKLSFQLVIHLKIWALCCMCTFIYATPILLSLVFESFKEDNLFFAILRGSLNSAGVQSIMLNTTFLILNRIQAILFPSLMLRKKHYLQYLTIVTFSISFIVVFVIVFRRGYNPIVQSEQGCVAFACRMLGQLEDLSIYKLAVGLINMVLGIFFIGLYVRFAKKSSIRRENRKNLAVLLICLTEFLFTVVPNLLYLVTDNIVLPFVELRIATFRAVGFSTDALLTTIVYWATWLKVIRNSQAIRQTETPVQHINTNNITYLNSYH